MQPASEATPGTAARILVGGAERSRWTTAGSALCLAVAASPWLMPELPGWPSFTSALALIVIEGVSLARRWRRRYVIDLGDAMQVEDRHGQRRIPIESICAVAAFSRVVRANGRERGVRQHLRVWTEGAEASTDLAYLVPQGSTDPLRRLRTDIVSQLAERVFQSLARGQILAEPTWSLDRSQLTLRSGRAAPPRRHDIGRVSAAGRFGGELRVWVAGEDVPIARLPLHGRNVPVLAAILERQIAASPHAAAYVPGTMGRMLFERRGSSGARILRVVGAVLALAGVAIVLLSDAAALPIGLVGAGVGTALALLGARLMRSYLRCHEGGVAQGSGLGSTRTLLFDEIATFAYASTRHYYNGAYTGTSFSLRFVPTGESGRKPIRYTGSITGDADESDLAALRDRAAQHVYERLCASLDTGKPAPWTPKVQLTRDGLLAGRRRPRLVRWDEVRAWEIQYGTLRVLGDERRRLLRVPCADLGFYPGFALFTSALGGE